MPLAENFARALLNSVGISPEQFRSDLKLVMDEFHAIKADRIGFRRSSVSVVIEFRETMERIESEMTATRELLGRLSARQEMILAELRAARDARENVPVATNGVANHVGKQHE
jgi:hypothetical protein